MKKIVPFNEAKRNFPEKRKTISLKATTKRKFQNSLNIKFYQVHKEQRVKGVVF